MECPRCHSHRIVRFIDAFGTKRIFCKDCWVSIPESTLLQTKILDFRPKLSPRPPASPPSF